MIAKAIPSSSINSHQHKPISQMAKWQNKINCQAKCFLIFLGNRIEKQIAGTKVKRLTTAIAPKNITIKINAKSFPKIPKS